MQSKKDDVVFFPGWMYSSTFYGFKDELHIWEQKLNLQQVFIKKLFVAHSLGCAYAINLWQNSQSCKLVLVNPFLHRQTKTEMVFEHLKYLLSETPKFKHALPIKFYTQAVKNAIFLFKQPTIEIFKKIPKEKYKIFFGNKDEYSVKTKKILKENKIPFEVVDGQGHNWNSVFEKIVAKQTSIF